MIFAIETSCDETSTAILSLEGKLLSHIIVNQENHSKFGGVVPEIASRAHLEILQKIIPQSLKNAGIKVNNIEIFSATSGPGLIGGLLVGSIMAKSMALGSNKPFYPINHLEGHLLSPLINSKLKFPYLAFLLTGGHTQIYLVEKIGCYKLLGESVDDAIGESFDKVAKLLGLGYPGGPLIEKKAKLGDKNSYNLPHPLEFKKTLNFSFSGIKTAVTILVKNQKKIDEELINNLSASFQNKIIEILIKKASSTIKYVYKKGYKINDIAIVGGVAANEKINSAFRELCEKNNCNVFFPKKEFCGDNAAMIAWACLERYKNDLKPDLNFKPNPRWSLSKIISL
tara:strand:- start:3656 stop:4678 length:1023 start_codon:yes stop_codon:yes gene_type:complete